MANINQYPQEVMQSAIPFSQYTNSAPGENPTIMEMRWEAQNLMLQLWAQLAGRVPMVVEGKPYLVKETPTIKSLMNDIGARDIINIVRGMVNSPVSLSNIKSDAADIIYRQVTVSIISAININQDKYEIDGVAEMHVICASIFPILYCQINRAVNGHESKNSRTQTQEVKQESMSTNKTQGGFNLNPFK